MIDSETPFTQVLTNFLPVQPVYTEPRANSGADWSCLPFKILQGSKGPAWTKGKSVQDFVLSNIFLDSCKRGLKGLITPLNTIIIKRSCNGPAHDFELSQSCLIFSDFSYFNLLLITVCQCPFGSYCVDQIETSLLP